MIHTKHIQAQAPITKQHTTKHDTRSHILRGNECILINQPNVLEDNKAFHWY